MMINLLHLRSITITIVIMLSTSHLHSVNGDDNHNISTPPIMRVNEVRFSSRKLILLHGGGGAGGCRSRDISISQSKDSIMSSGIPRFIVQIVNTCTDDVYSSSSCGGPSNIHLHCGWFASARMVNPRIFKRIAYDDCIVNEGKPLRANQIISFTYSNSFMYSISLKFAHFC